MLPRWGAGAWVVSRQLSGVSVCRRVWQQALIRLERVLRSKLTLCDL